MTRRRLLAAAAVLAVLIAGSLLIADGVVTAPANIAPDNWKIASVHMVTGSGQDVPSVNFTLHYFVGAETTPAATSTVTITGAEIASYATTINSPVAGETGSAAKRHRQRITAWLISNGKILNVTPE